MYFLWQLSTMCATGTNIQLCNDETIYICCQYFPYLKSYKRVQSSQIITATAHRYYTHRFHVLRSYVAVGGFCMYAICSCQPTLHTHTHTLHRSASSSSSYNIVQEKYNYFYFHKQSTCLKCSWRMLCIVIVTNQKIHWNTILCVQYSAWLEWNAHICCVVGCNRC